MFKVKREETAKLNHQVNQLKQDEIKDYHQQLSRYLKNVVVLSLRVLYNNSCTNYSINLDSPKGSLEEQLGELIDKPPYLGDLSLPEFLGQTSEDGNKYDIIDLPKGYLYIYLDGRVAKIMYHVDKPDHLNPYLDVNKTFKSELPTLLRDNGVVMTWLYSLSRLTSLIKLL